jgi:23S rRNA (adenine2503-C2)-methyltransferase
VRDTRGSDIDGACGQLAASDRVEGVPSVATSLAETVSAAVGEDVVPLGAAPEDTEEVPLR